MPSAPTATTAALLPTCKPRSTTCCWRHLRRLHPDRSMSAPASMTAASTWPGTISACASAGVKRARKPHRASTMRWTRADASPATGAPPTSPGACPSSARTGRWRRNSATTTTTSAIRATSACFRRAPFSAVSPTASSASRSCSRKMHARTSPPCGKAGRAIACAVAPAFTGATSTAPPTATTTSLAARYSCRAAASPMSATATRSSNRKTSAPAILFSCRTNGPSRTTGN